MPQISSGVPQLDAVLGGGLPVGDLVLVMGAAGSGKTTLALQSAFHAAAQGDAACFVSTTSESPGRVLEHARSYAFYDEGLVGRRLFLLSVFPLIGEGLDRVREALEQTVREHEATLLVIDGLMTLYDLHPEPRAVRRFLYETAAAFAALGCTLLVTSSRTEITGSAHAAELTMADALILMSQTVVGSRSRRQLQVVKLRGRTPVLGLHTARIDARGLAVFPRFESLAGAGERAVLPGRVSTGTPELDAMLAGGLPAGSVTALAGSVGTGKTLLGLQFLLHGARAGERGLLLSLRETRDELVAKATSFGLDLAAALESGRITLLHRSSVDVSADEVVHALGEQLAGADYARCVIDGVAELADSIANEARRGALMQVLSDLLRRRGATSLAPVPVPQVVGPELDLARTPLAALAQNLVLLRYVEYRGELYRIVSVLKARDSDFDASIRRYVITARGLRVLEPLDTADALLTGIAQLTSEARVKRAGEPQAEP